jgi:hypothetical protein
MAFYLEDSKLYERVDGLNFYLYDILRRNFLEHQ